MSQDYRRKVTTTRTSTTYGSTGNRSAWGYWVPLAFTVTAATVALGAWIWSERSEEEDASESEAEHYYASGAQQGRRDQSNIGAAAAAAGAAGLGAAAGYGGMSGGPPPGPGPTGSSSGPAYGGSMPGPPAQGGFIGAPGPQGPPGPPSRGEAESYFRDTSHHDQTTSTTNVNTQSTQQEQTFFGRMSNALGMTRSVTPGGTNTAEGAGWAAAATGALAVAGGMVEKAVQQVRGSQDDAHSSDQEKWAEEADKPGRTQSTLSAAAAGAASGAVLGRGSRSRSKSPAPGLARQGTAQEFYSGAVDLPRRTSLQAKKRRTVAVVVSSVDRPGDSLSVDTHHSILAQLPQHIRTDTTRIVVLIYAPDLHTHPLSFASRRAGERNFERRASASVHSNTSSYQHIHTPGSNLGTEPLNTPLQTPGDFPQDAVNSNSDDQGILAHVDPKPMDSSTSLVRTGSHTNDEFGLTHPLDEQTSALFKTLYNQASAIVDRDTSILLYTSSNGHKHILKSVQPEIVYIQESLCGRSGEVVAELHGWVRQVVVVIGDEGGMGALVDSDVEVESEEDSNGHRKSGMVEGEKWWKREEVSGVGRGVSVVEGLRVGEDWERRVNEAE